MKSEKPASVVFQAAEPRHADLLFRLIESYFAYDEIFFDGTAIAAGLRFLLEDPSVGRAWLISLSGEGEIVGYIIVTFGFDLEFGGKRATLTDLYIEPGSRGGGIGTAAIAWVEQASRELGMNAIELQVETDNIEAQGLYRKAGFKAHTRIAMSKRLGPR